MHLLFSNHRDYSGQPSQEFYSCFPFLPIISARQVAFCLKMQVTLSYILGYQSFNRTVPYLVAHSRSTLLFTYTEIKRPTFLTRSTLMMIYKRPPAGYIKDELNPAPHSKLGSRALHPTWCWSSISSLISRVLCSVRVPCWLGLGSQ